MFKVGQLVQFEIIKDGNTPRHNFSKDGGGSYVWETGEIVKILDDYDIMVVISHETGRPWAWPTPSHPDWDAKKAGWIKLSVFNEVKTTKTFYQMFLERRQRELPTRQSA